MTASGGSPFGDFDDLFKTNFDGSRKKPEPKKEEKGVVWQAKSIDGVYYVSLKQVLELLEINDVLPAVRRGLERRL